MPTTKILAIALLAAGVSTPVFAEPVTEAPMAISIGVTFDQSADSELPLSTLSAAMSTGGTAAVANATAMVAKMDRTPLNGTTANGGATSYGAITSQVGLGEGGFQSQVYTGMID